MEDSTQKGKRVVKNTLFLYIRMFLLLLITLYTSRIILDKLGVEDYGIYNIVGGLAAMFAFFSTSISNAMQRFLSFEIGKGENKKLGQVYTQSLLIFAAFALLIVILCETIGLWFVYNKLIIPEARFQTAVYVYHITVLMVCFNFVGLAFNSILIAHENMKIYSLVGIVEGVAKLVVVFILSITSGDRLLCYSLMLLTVCFSVQCFYFLYCRRKYTECHLQKAADFDLFKSIGRFMGWNTAGAVIYMTKDQCLNILLNTFFGPAVNAARGLAFQINAAISQFINGIFVSVQPQLTKAYAAGDKEYLLSLFFRSTKYSVIAFNIIGLPVIFCIDEILSIWLVEVPQYVSIFTIWVVVDSMFAIMTNAPWGITIATGNIRNYQLLGNGVLLLILPVSYFFLKAGASPVSVFVITFLVRLIQVITTHLIANQLIHFGLLRFMRVVVLPIVITVVPTAIIMFFICKFLPSGFIGVLLKAGLSTCMLLFITYSLAIPSERNIANQYIKSKFNK